MESRKDFIYFSLFIGEKQQEFQNQQTINANIAYAERKKERNAIPSKDKIWITNKNQLQMLPLFVKSLLSAYSGHSNLNINWPAPSMAEKRCESEIPVIVKRKKSYRVCFHSVYAIHAHIRAHRFIWIVRISASIRKNAVRSRFHVLLA